MYVCENTLVVHSVSSGTHARRAVCAAKEMMNLKEQGLSAAAAPGPRPAAATGHMRRQKPIVPSELFKFQVMHARVYCSRR